MTGPTATCSNASGPMPPSLSVALTLIKYKPKRPKVCVMVIVEVVDFSGGR